MRLRMVSRMACAAGVCISVCWSVHGAQGLRVFHIGNSYTDQAYAMHNIAVGKGYTDVLWGRKMVAGAPIRWIWDMELQTGGQALSPVTNPYLIFDGSVATYLATTPVDVLVLQLFPQNGDNAETMTDKGGNFAEAAYQGNPDCQVYVFGSYPASAASFGTSMPSYNTMAVQGAAGISARFPSRKPALVIPVMQVLQQAGPDGLIADGDGHVNKNGRYLEALTHFAAIYRDDPRGAVTSGLFFWQEGVAGYSVDQAFATNAQSIVFDVVKNYPQSGFNTTAAADSRHVLSARPASAFTGATAGLLDLQGRLVSAMTGHRPDACGLFYASAGEIRPTIPRTAARSGEPHTDPGR